MGHALDDSIQDAIVREARMRGRSTQWILGTDHAGIATQTKVDKKLKEEGKNRLEMGRDAFIDACWDWTHEYGGTIKEQIKRMGCSVDFEHERFTMDDDYAEAVRRATASSTAASASSTGAPAARRPSPTTRRSISRRRVTSGTSAIP